MINLCLVLFSSLGLSQDLLEAVKVAGYETPTFVQERSIPLILKGNDLSAQAKTWTGKTASFALPILQLLQDGHDEERKTIKALILTPTRELARKKKTEEKKQRKLEKK